MTAFILTLQILVGAGFHCNVALDQATAFCQNHRTHAWVLVQTKNSRILKATGVSS